MAPTPSSSSDGRDLREEIDDLGERLGRIGAAAVGLRALAADARPGVRQDALVALLDQLERDLAFAARASRLVRARAATDRA